MRASRGVGNYAEPNVARFIAMDRSARRKLISTDVHCRGSEIESTGASAAVRSGRRTSSWLLAAGVLVSHSCAIVAADAALVEKGASLYQLRCEGCHGVNLRNTSGGWSFDLRKLKPDEHERFVESVTSGKDNMPSWYGILKDDEIEAIWSYIRATVDR
jgi:mono/diheme cytochrome c family protein